MIDSTFEYVMRVGEEVREGLFPRPRVDGRQPIPLPVLLHYKLPEGEEVEVTFVMRRTYHHIGEGPTDIRASMADVTFAGEYIGTIDLCFGKELDDSYYLGDAWRNEVNLLLRAVKGVLKP